MAYVDFKDLSRRVINDKVLRDKAFNNGYQRGNASMVYKFFDKNSSSGTVKSEIISNKELSEELHKIISRKLEKKKSTPTIYRQYFGRRSSRYAIDK